MTRSSRPRIDYAPGKAAQEAIAEVAQRFPQWDNQQDLLDRLILTGASALLHEHWAPPRLFEQSRHRWRWKKKDADSR